MAIDKADECLLVEGYTDVIALHQAGIENVVASGGTSLTTDQLRLVKKYTSNLTIIYDGDSAGIKASLRGLDLALEEGLNVKLVLIPDKEDPDSYVNKVGPLAFKAFIEKNKKDFVLFQLEIALQDAGADSNKKASVVNQIAETISKINKAEDFTKQQDYIRQCSQLLKIDESGFTNLVNKFIRERIAKEGTRIPQSESRVFESITKQKNEQLVDDTIELLLEDEYHEREVVKRLIEYGNHNLDETKHVADIIFEVLDQFHLTNNKLEKIVEAYHHMLETFGYIDSKTFLYSNDVELN